MNTLFPVYFADQLVQKIAPAVPPEVQQLAHQLDAQMQQILTDFAHYGLLVAGLTSAIALLLSSLLLVLNYPTPKLVQPNLRLIHSAPGHRRPKRPVENRVAKANRDELQLVSARIRSGQLSN